MRINLNTKMLSKWTAITLIGLLILYYAITLVSTEKISKQVDVIRNHPFPVSLAAEQVNTCVAQLRLLTERLTYVRTPEVLEVATEHYQDINSDIAENINFISDRYLTNKTDPSNLQDVYGNLCAEQEKLLALCLESDPTDEEISIFVSQHIEPLLIEMESISSLIVNRSENKFMQLQQLADDTRFSTIFLATILTLSVIGALSIYVFIIRRKNERETKLREALRGALDSAQSANTAKSQFLSNMSHDIRTPMNAIIGMTAIAGMHLEEPPKVKDCLMKISTSSKHLLGLINDVLDMSKIESGKITLNNEPFLLPDLVHNFITIIQPQVNAKQLKLNINASNLNHEKLVGDTLRINQILLNIMGNAIKFTEAGGEVSLKIVELPPQHSGYGTYQFHFSDTGCGMSQEFIDKIFQPFERVDTSTNSKIEGTGLGMAITKSIVDMMNGQISVQSQLGCGSTFTVTLHLKLQNSEDEALELHAFQELRSLVVDDDQDVCEDTARLLEEIGIKSDCVMTGEEAVDKAVLAHQIKADYHSVIIDWKMPNMDGLETARQIRSQLGETVPIIILTAYDWIEIEEEARLAGVNAFLAKPLFKSSLYHVMQDIVNGQAPTMAAAKDSNKECEFSGRILLVEDNTINMEIALEFIRRSGCKTEEAWDGRDAVRMVKEAPEDYYKLIFMDVQMPNLNGYEATRQIRQMELAGNRRHTPIVAMSANAFIEDVDKAYEVGMDGYITKPVSMEEIQGTLRKYLIESI